jgi:hypothetical protein
MAYVIEYTVVPAFGQPKVVEAVSHQDAAMRFLKEPVLRWQTSQGDYEPQENGENLTVIGYTQQELSHFRHTQWHAEQIRKDLASGTRHGKKLTKTEAEELRKVEAELRAMPHPQNHVVTFKLTSHLLWAPEYVSGLPEKNSDKEAAA